VVEAVVGVVGGAAYPGVTFEKELFANVSLNERLGRGPVEKR